jgi:uncharacterized protein
MQRSCSEFGWSIDANIEAALQKAEELGGERVMGPEKVMDRVELGQFKDPEGHLIGLVRGSE